MMGDERPRVPYLLVRRLSVFLGGRVASVVGS